MLNNIFSRFSVNIGHLTETTTRIRQQQQLNRQQLSYVTERFRERCYLPPSEDFKLIECTKNNNKKLSDNFKKHIKKGTKILELYHVCREDSSHTRCGNSDSIMEHGFTMCNPYGNKGYGIYLASHGRYSLNWTGPRVPVIVCHVIYNNEDNTSINNERDDIVNMYRSEIYSPKNSFEYRISNREHIYPAYMIKYNTVCNSEKKDSNFQQGYVKHGDFGCDVCDTKNEYGYATRCDCKLCNINFNDIIDVSY